MSAPYVLSLDDPLATDATLAGGKAAALATVRAADLPVPPGFVITSAAFDAAHARSAEAIAAALAGRERGTHAAAVEARLSDLLASARVPRPVRDAVRDAWADFAGRSLAVRSSATHEDLAGASFAGQYDSYLGATSERQLWSRVRAVWGSLHAPRALAYRDERGIAQADARMAVLVQALVPAQAAGVLFTCDPVSGAGDRMIVNATLGLADALVSGRSAADAFVLDAQTHAVVERTVVDKPIAIVVGANGRVRRTRVAAGRRRAPALQDSTLAELGALAARVRALFGDHRDIEFAVGDDGVRLVQARPITAGAAAPPFTVHWDDPRDAGRFWTRMSDEPEHRLEGELRERAAVHLRRSFALTGAPFTRSSLVRHIHGYRYQADPEIDEQAAIARQRRWRRRAERHLERGTPLYFAEIEPETLALIERVERSRPRAVGAAMPWFDHLRVAAEAWGRVLHDLHWRMAAASRAGEALPPVYAEVTGEPPIEAAVLLQGIDNQTTRLVKRLRALARIVQSDRPLARAIGARDYERLAAPPLRDRPAVRRLLRGRRALLRAYGQRTGHGFGSAARFTEPTWNMDPARVLDVVASYAAADLDALDRQERRAKRERGRALRRARRLAARDPDLAERFERALFAGTAMVRGMENHNHLMEQRTAGLLREAIHGLGRALVAAGRIAEPDDVLHLSLRELRSAARTAGPRARDLRAIVRARRVEHAERMRIAAPEHLGSGRPARVPSGRDLFEGDGPTGLQDGLLRGVPASRGRRSGRAHVVRTRDGRLPALARGDILVAENAGPDWTPLFPLLGALVLDQGAAFQHAALVAREYGIPAVVMTVEATRVIANGEPITVDGTRGVVELSPRAR